MLHNRTVITTDKLRPFLATTLERTDFKNLGERYEGKVRDVYRQPERTILIATDRQSAFDISWCTIPLKGQALNQLSAWWFERVKDIMPTHVIAVPDPNVTVVKPLKMLKVEIVVRAYMTGSTSTSLWMNYQQGMRNICGNELKDGMTKNDKLDHVILTPTTKAENDEIIGPDEIVSRGLATKEQWEEIESNARKLFTRGQEIADARGLILVDTKYEMGYDDEGTLTLADEVHTPDSSRYWVKATYEERHARGEEPEYLDKEFFRLWLRSQGFEYGGKRPEITDDARLMLAERYIDLYERMTGEPFRTPKETDVVGRIDENLQAFCK